MFALKMPFLKSINQGAFLALAIFVVFSSLNGGYALAFGFIYALTINNPFEHLSKKLVSPILQIAVIALGASMNLVTIIEVGVRGIFYTIATIVLTLMLTFFLGRLLKIENKLIALLGVGTAICGGSAIAAASGTIRARPEQISIAMALIFGFNTLALYVFPFFGSFFSLSQTQFGLLCALAIHDTSSVVGATMSYGPEALMVGTTVKLARALWIAPISLALAFFWPKNPAESTKRISFPWFILGFIIMAALFTYVPVLSIVASPVSQIGKRLLVLALFLVGANFSIATFKEVGLKSFLLGFIIWFFISSFSLIFIINDIFVY